MVKRGQEERNAGTADGGERQGVQEGTEPGGGLARTQVQARLPLTLAMLLQVTDGLLTSILELTSDLVGDTRGRLVIVRPPSAWEHR